MSDRVARVSRAVGPFGSWPWLMVAAMMCTVVPTLADESTSGAAATVPEVVLEAPEPRYVAPTRRDRIGRIWAPVYINERGPFRFVLDTGASSSATTQGVADVLALDTTVQPPARLHGVTGSAVVPVIKVDSLLIGDMLLSGKRLPLVPDALGGAEGILGSEGLADRRVIIDFRNDHISIMRSHRERAPPGFITLPVKFMRGRLLTVAALVGNVRATAVIDTGGQVSIGNFALRDELQRRRQRERVSLDTIIGATNHTEIGEGYSAPPVMLGSITINSSHMTFGDMNIFKHWGMTDTPAILIGMDVLGLVDMLIIDYRRRELQLKLP